MKRFLLIGGIGSGKSSVSRFFAKYGAYCLDLDRVGHAVLRQDSIKAALQEAFGEEILSETGDIDRPSLAALAFANPESTAALNIITHGAIKKAAEGKLAQAEAEGYALAMVEVSAFSGPRSSFMGLIKPEGGIIAVVAPEPVRIGRALARGMDEDDARARMAQQPSDEERRVWADYVIENAGTLEELEQQVETVLAAIGAH